MSQIPPPPPPMNPMPGQPMGGPGLQEAPGATTGLVLGIICIVINIPILSMIMSYIGFQKAKEAKLLCDMNPGMYNNAGVAQAAYIVCIIAMVLSALSLVCGCGYIMIFAAAIGSGAMGGP